MIDTDIAIKAFLLEHAIVGPLIGNRVYDTLGIPTMPKPYVILKETPHSGQKQSQNKGALKFLQVNYDFHCYGPTKTAAKKLCGDIQDAFNALIEPPATLPVILSVATAPTIGLHLFTIRNVLSNHVMGINKTKTPSYRYVIDMSMAFKEKV